MGELGHKALTHPKRVTPRDAHIQQAPAHRQAVSYMSSTAKTPAAPQPMPGSSQASSADKLRAVGWMFGTLLSFSAMAVSGRQLSYNMDIFQVTFLRSVVGLLALAPFIWFFRAQIFRVQGLQFHFLRNSIHWIGQYLWFLGLSLLPLAQAFAIEFTMPIWTMIFGMLFFAERMTGPRLIAVFGGFLGVLLIVRPGLTVFNPAALIMLCAAFAFGVNIALTKYLMRGSTALAVVFWMNLIQMFIGLGPALYYWTDPLTSDYIWVAGVGLSGLIAHFTLARALRLVDMSFIMPIDFLRLPLIAIVGAVFYSEVIDPFVFIGGAVIVAVTWYAIAQEKRASSP